MMIDFIGTPCFVGFIGEQCVAPVDKNALQSLIDQAMGLDEGNYTPASWSVLSSSMASAQAVLADVDSTQEQVDSALLDLQAAIDQLQTVADKTDLNAEISRAQSLTEEDYTPDSWSAMIVQLDAAGLVFADPNASQQEVDDAMANLRDAIDALEPADGV